jgi:multidrug resistance protein, MATE family
MPAMLFYGLSDL